jgi:hypothetical protein
MASSGQVIPGARMTRFASLLLAAALAAMPAVAMAGAPEQAFLAKLPGVWTGKGTLTGAETGTVNCTLTIRQRSDGVNFSAKCDVSEFGPQNFSGVIGYNDATGRYEARSQGGEITIGTKSGNSVVFTAEMKGIAEGTTTMKVGTSRIVVDTKARRPGSSGEIQSRIELRR